MKTIKKVIKDSMKINDSIEVRIKRSLHKGYLILARKLFALSEPNKKTPNIGAVRKRFLVASLIFIALALESFINEFGEDNVKEFEDLEKLSPDVKWTLLPKLASGLRFEFKKGKEPFQSIRMVFEYRNFLVHYKPRFRDPHRNKMESKYNKLSHKEVGGYYQNAVRAMKQVCTKLKLKRVFCSWLADYPEEITAGV